MAEIIINKEKHECPPAVAAYIKQLERNNLNLQEEFYKQGTKIDELKAENARLEEGYQKSVGVIAATDCVKCKDKEYINDVNYAISCIRGFCKDRKCKTCPISIDGRCSLGGLTPKGWENSIKALDEEIYGKKKDGGADNADSGKSV